MLKTYHTITDLQQILFQEKESGHTIGFVPTMGALHKGHISLIEKSKKACDITVSSIFVNPTQFNDPLDFRKYPRAAEKDEAMLEDAGCDFLFLPSVEEIYPTDVYKSIDFDPGLIGQRLEGRSRPGHFNGMAAVVKRLFDIIKPDKAFFGLKDYQQYLIVKKMVEWYRLPIEVVGCPIIREQGGLAMSSRNQRLSPDQQQKANVIYKTLTEAAHKINEQKLSFEAIINEAVAVIQSNGEITVDYFDICNKNDLLAAINSESINELIILVAVYMGDVRLIDNLIV